MVDYPDGTLPIAINVDFNIVQGDVDTKVERVVPKTACSYGNPVANLVIPAAPAGKKTGLLMIVASTDTDLSKLRISVYKDDILGDIMDYIYVGANKPLVLLFPPFMPEQDVSDGSKQNMYIELLGAGCYALNGLFAMYFYE